MKKCGDPCSNGLQGKSQHFLVFQQLYSVHLADQSEDCTVQLADHIKVFQTLQFSFSCVSETV